MPYRGYSRKEEVTYLSVTIHAVCNTCGAKTDNAEGDGWTTNPDYTEYQCPKCQKPSEITTDKITHSNKATNKGR